MCPSPRCASDRPTKPAYGAITASAQYEKIQTFFETVSRDGLTPATGGKFATGPAFGDGWFIEPTVYTGVTNDMQIAREEVFGPY